MKLKMSFVLVLLISLIPMSVQAEEDQSVYYYILIDRFESGEENGEIVDIDDPAAFQGGDFAGIMNRVDHLDTLGVTHVILSPIFEANEYTGMDVSSYDHIQETFGTEEELNQLINTLNDHNIEVILHFPIKDGVGESEWLSQLKSWEEQLPIDGYYISEIERFSNDLWESAIREVNGSLIGETNENIDEYLKLGFDKVHDRSNQEALKSYFSQPDQSVDELLEGSNIEDKRVIQSMDFIDTNRFTHEFSETGSHPVTYWKLALTYLMTVSNDTLIYQGSEIPLDGVKEDLSHHQLMNFLAGEDQLIRHIEKITNAYDDLPSLAMGDLELLHAEDSYLVFKKSYEDENTIVAINTSTTQQRTDIELEDGQELRGLLEDDLIRQNDDGTYSITVDREASNIFMVQENTGFYWPLIFIFAGGMTIFIIFTVMMYRKNKT
ncbi:alpha-amylase family glycosyl hydrolase [Piscibacillus halophilus]|uniref:Alpha amylase, catalytic domain n=1 Tax=Piscibacillus halophilus TaxID=571933 RepID=A0A1H9B1R4_9BACI|nr:alpha-amylase family glycosyl hydrolase [Piscibacillus halophilus]SEP82765.1 Alpha amylase, catalytic domain [Piscibacillus halophilus]